MRFLLKAQIPTEIGNKMVQDPDLVKKFEDYINSVKVAGEDVPIMSSSVEGDKKTTQTMYTDTKGRATFTVQLGPNSDTGTYDTEVEVSKDSYQSGFKQTDLHVI